MFQSVNHSALDPRLLAGDSEISLKPVSEIEDLHRKDAEIRGGFAENTADSAEELVHDTAAPDREPKKPKATVTAGGTEPRIRIEVGERAATSPKIADKSRRATPKSSQRSRQKQ